MALVPVDPTYGAALIDLEDIGSSVESLARLVESQKELFHSQIDQLQKIVATQCKLTGANPLAQEMAAGALSIKIGKRPRDLLNPKAVKYMQSIFSIKDTIGKKETREISALCGITVTQVRDYFSSQRSRVRKLVRLSQEKATESDASKAITDGSSDNPNHSAPGSKDTTGNTSDLGIVGDSTQIPGHSGNAFPVNLQSLATPTPLNASPVCTQFHVGPNNFKSIYSQVSVNSGNFTAVGTHVHGSLVHATPLSTVAPVNSGNFASVFTPIIGYSGIVNAASTLVPVSFMNGTHVQDGLLGHMKTNIKPMEESSMKANIKPMEEGPSGSSQEETTPGVDSDDKKFLENIFSLMRKEQTFSGRVKLMEWVLQIHNSAVLSWFSTKGGITILATWLSEAALEEQTTVLLVIFKVLCHLPLNKAQPVQMSAILQTVNRLRFYRSSDISNRAKVLLSRWSKMFVRSQALRNSRNSLRNGQKGTVHKQRTNEVLGDESWKSNLDIPEDILALAGSCEDGRESDPKNALKLLTDSSEGSTRKQARTVTTKTKERRKVLLVEHPDSKAGRSPPVARAVPSNHNRPMSADDIQKAKMRAIHMQDKYGKSNTPASENSPQQAEDHKSSPASHECNSSPANRIPQLPQLRTTEPEKSTVPAPTDKSVLKAETSNSLKPNLPTQEQMLEKLKKNQIQWSTPPEIRLNSSWGVGGGENSKEVQGQTQRNRRENETLYHDPKDIPPNPKEPWDVEMDFDDSLTPEIPVDQPSDPESPVYSPTGGRSAPNAVAAAADELPSTSAAVPATEATGNAAPEPDAELLLVLLKNPEVVEALTKGEGRNLTEEQLVALLEMVKRAGTGATGLLDGLEGGSLARPREPEPEPVSLPSPTPPSRTDWRPEFPSPALVAPVGPNVLHPPSPPSMMPMSINSPNQATIMSLPQLPVTINPSQQHHHHLPSPNLMPNKPPGSMYPSSHQHYQVNHPPMQPLHPGPAWPPADGIADFPRRDMMPDYRDRRVPLDDTVTSTSNYYANNDNNSYNPNSYNLNPRANDYVHIPEGGPAVGLTEPRVYPHGAGAGSGNYSEFDRSHKWSRQRHWSSGQRHPYGTGGGRGGGGRWRGRGGRR